MGKGTDLSTLFSLRNDFTIIALTGRNGSGYHRVAQLLEKGFEEETYSSPDQFSLLNNSYKKYKIIYNYAKENFKRFNLIRYRDVLTLYFLEYSFDQFKQFIQSEEVKDFFIKSKVDVKPEFSKELANLETLADLFNEFKSKFSLIPYRTDIKQNRTAYDFCFLFFGQTFKDFSSRLHQR